MKREKVINHLLELIKGAFVSGEDVLISGFGKFEVLNKKARSRRNPKKIRK